MPGSSLILSEEEKDFLDEEEMRMTGLLRTKGLRKVGGYGLMRRYGFMGIGDRLIPLEWHFILHVEFLL